MIRAWSAPSVGAKFEQISYDPGPMKGDDVEIAVTSLRAVPLRHVLVGG
jgi:hypothetical protein